MAVYPQDFKPSEFNVGGSGWSTPPKIATNSKISERSFPKKSLSKHFLNQDVSPATIFLPFVSVSLYYPIYQVNLKFRVSPVRGEQEYHEVLFSGTGTHKKDHRVQKSAKSAILTSSMTVELLLVALR